MKYKLIIITLSSLLLFIFVSQNIQAQKLVTYPIPQQVLYSLHKDDFTVQVKLSGEKEWQDLYEYKVPVDMDTKSEASMVQFDFEGKVEVKVKKNNGVVNDVWIRPLSKKIKYNVKDNIIYFTLDKPSKLSLEVNGDRLNNLHIFANALEKEIPNIDDPNVVYFDAGVHKPEEGSEDIFNIASNQTVYLAPGAVVQGKFVCNKVENVRFIGRGIILNPHRGFEITYSNNIEIDGITVINPTHYTVYGGQSSNIKINNMKSFSTKGWSDGIDLMSCSEVTINDIFMRNSDDCIAIYTHRWDYFGDARNYNITNAILWADIAHPINIGLHGDTSFEGNTVENIHFSNIDILEQDEDDRNYQGCMALSVSDHNLVQNLSFENVRIENIQEGQLFNLRVLYNEKYSSGPGRGIKNISFKNISYNGNEPNPSIIEGYSSDKNIDNVKFENIIINGRRAKTAEDIGLKIGKFTKNITIK